MHFILSEDLFYINKQAFNLGFIVWFPVYKGLIWVHSMDEKKMAPDQLASLEAS